MDNLEIVNMVAVGNLGKELDLAEISEDVAEAEYDPETYNGLYIRFKENPLIVVFRTGKYIVSGGNSIEELEKGRKSLLELFQDLGIITESFRDHEFSVVNYVCQANLNRDLDLNAVSIGLGLEKTEYEPEQFPGLVYRPPNSEAVLLIFASGKVIVTGSEELEPAKEAFHGLRNKLDQIL